MTPTDLSEKITALEAERAQLQQDAQARVTMLENAIRTTMNDAHLAIGNINGRIEQLRELFEPTSGAPTNGASTNDASNGASKQNVPDDPVTASVGAGADAGAV